MSTVAAAIHKFWVESAQHPDIQNPFLGGFTLKKILDILEQLHLKANLSAKHTGGGGVNFQLASTW